MGGGLPREGVGGQKVQCVLRNPGKPNFWAVYPGFLAGHPGLPEKFEKKKVRVQFLDPRDRWSCDKHSINVVFADNLWKVVLRSVTLGPLFTERIKLDNET